MVRLDTTKNKHVNPLNYHPILQSQCLCISLLLVLPYSIFYFEPRNVENLVDQIIHIYNNPRFVKNKIKNAKKLVTKYNWQAEREKLLKFYNDLFLKNGGNSNHEI